MGNVNRRELDILKTDSGTKGHVLFEGYRRGTRFEVVDWTAFDEGVPFTEYVKRTAPVEGQDTALVVRLRVNGRWPMTTKEEIRSELFNSNGDDRWNINLFERCSYGQYKIVPFTGPYAGLATYGGVMDFDIDDYTIKERDNFFGTIYEEYMHIASYLLPYDDSVDFIMFVLPSGIDWGKSAAAARVNGRFSIYDDESIINPFTVGHEIGHNLGLKHSADTTSGGEYGDHTCLMGNGYVKEDLRGDFDENTHCFNTAKNWQLGWMADRTAQWFPSMGLKTFELVGLGDYRYSSSLKDNQVVGLEITQKDGKKIYLGFNRKSGINSDIKEYPDLVTASVVFPKGVAKPKTLKHELSYLHFKLGSQEWNNAKEWSVYVESIEIKPEGQASVARIILGTKEEIWIDNEINNRPMNCIVDSEKSAQTCTEECGSVPGVPEDGHEAFFGGSCAEYECQMNDGNCTVGAPCGDHAWTELHEELEMISPDYLKTVTDHLCETWMQFPESVFSDMTCVWVDSPVRTTFDLMVSEYYPFCTHDFSSNAWKDEKEMKIELTLTYTIEGTSNAEDHESSAQFANTIFAQSVADLLGEDPKSVEANVDRKADKIEISIITKHHTDMALRVNHKWFLMRLQEKLTYYNVVANLGNLQYEESEIEEEKSFLEKYMLILIGGACGVVAFIIGLIICLCVPCGSSPTIIHKSGPQVVRRKVNFNGAVLA